MRGTDSLESLATATRARGMDRFALTDTNALYGFVFYRQICDETGLIPIAGAEVVEVPAYSTVLAELSPEARTALEAGIDILTFTSSSTVRNFIEQVGAAMAQRLAAQARVVTIGPITATTARELGLRVDVVAAEYTIAGLVAAMVAMA